MPGVATPVAFLTTSTTSSSSSYGAIGAVTRDMPGLVAFVTDLGSGFLRAVTRYVASLVAIIASRRPCVWTGTGLVTRLATVVTTSP